MANGSSFLVKFMRNKKGLPVYRANKICHCCAIVAPMNNLRGLLLLMLLLLRFDGGYSTARFCGACSFLTPPG